MLAAVRVADPACEEIGGELLKVAEEDELEEGEIVVKTMLESVEYWTTSGTVTTAVVGMTWPGEVSVTVL